MKKAFLITLFKKIYEDINTIFLLCQIGLKRFKTKNSYPEFQAFQAEIIIKKSGWNLKGKKVLDVACGHGGYVKTFQDHGAKVFPIEYNVDAIHPMLSANTLVSGNALKLPYKKSSFDLVFCSSVIEHVAKPMNLIWELHRVLKTGGICYLSFPPFYSLKGGHNISPFHYLGEKMAISIAFRLRKQTFKQYGKDYKTLWGNFGLYPLKIRDVRNMISGVDFSTMRIQTRLLNTNFARVPFLNEFLTWHVEFILKK